MKKIISMLALAALVFTTSCDDVLDVSPADSFSPATVWTSGETADAYLIGLYSIFNANTEFYCASNAWTSPKLTDAYSDILKSGSWDLYAHNYNRVLFQTTSFSDKNAGAFECWATHYDRIRRQNGFLEDLEKYGRKFGEEWCAIREAEVRACRAYAYYLLARVYGGVIIRDKLDDISENNKARATEEETWNFIMTEMEAAAEALPVAWDKDNLGRLTKKAAYGLLSRIALYAHAWETAYKAADKAKEAGAALTANYGDLFNVSNDMNNPEVLFAVDYDTNIMGHLYDRYVRPSGYVTGGTAPYSAFVPTSELVDSYEMADGTAFSWTTHGTDPYTGREPRFYATILYNGADWEGRQVESFVGGKDGYKAYENASAAGTTVTGYYIRKYLREYETQWAGAKSGQYWILCRYAEVLLNKAEALAEENWTQNSTAALAALNEVRDRVGLPGRSAATKDQFMEYIRHERMVELAVEGFRYWDIRRWRLGETLIHDQNVHGVKITKQGDGSFKYDQVDADGGNKRVFYSRYYYFSIPEDERTANPLCENNDGWN